MTHHKSFLCGNPPFFLSLKKNTIVPPVRERAFGARVNFKKGHWKQITHHCQFEGLYGAWRRHMEGMMWRGSLSLFAFWNQVMFLHFTLLSSSLRIVKACVNNQSNYGLWRRAHWKKKKAQTLEVDLIFCTRGKQVLEPAVVDGGSVWA